MLLQTLHFLLTRVPAIIAQRLWHTLAAALGLPLPPASLEHLSVPLRDELYIAATKYATESAPSLPALNRRIQAHSMRQVARLGPRAQRESVLFGEERLEGWWLRAEPRSDTGDNADEAVLLYFHGGYYLLGNAVQHAMSLVDLLQRCAPLLPCGRALAIFSLQYGLAPAHKYPRQLQQSVAAYQWLAHRGHTTIFIGGDSAGGNLALGLLLVLRDGQAGCRGGPAAAGALLVSPRVNSSQTYDDVPNDTLNARLLAQSLRLLLPPEDYSSMLTHPHMSPLFAPLSGLPPMCVTLGGNETYAQDIALFVRQACAAGVWVELVTHSAMCHCYPLLHLQSHAPANARQQAAECLCRLAGQAAHIVSNNAAN